MPNNNNISNTIEIKKKTQSNTYLFTEFNYIEIIYAI